jgi:glycosyltransferase involved in cell wall biosynthesis
VKGPVSVIIPTTAESSRRESLLRAIDSVRGQNHAAAELIVVANGPRCEPSVLEMLEALPLRVLRLEEGNLPAAIRCGRRAVRTGYFAFLDDDDIYLPDALASRIDTLESQAADFAVSNGLNAAGQPLIEDIRAVERNPLRALLARNWLASCGGLYRSATIATEMFDGLVKYFEWTTLALHLLTAGKKVCFVDQLTYRISDTEGSESKQRSTEAMLNGIQTMENLFECIPAEVRAGFSCKRAAAYHETSAQYLLDGRMTEAWRMHISSILRGGWRYFPYTRHLLRRSCTTWLRE